MYTTLLLAVALALVWPAGATAQQLPETPPAQEQPRPPSPQRTSVPVNVRIDLTITDSRADAAAAPKTVTLVLADRENGRIRTGAGNLVLNVDARATMVGEGRVSTFVSLQYQPRREEAERSEPGSIMESLTVILENGKPLVVSQSADPSTDRRVKVELKATVLK